MKYLIQIFRDMKRGENLDQVTIIILVLAISFINILGFKDIFGLSIGKVMESLTLVTLGLVAIGLLVTRYKIEDISNATNTIDLVKFELQKPKYINQLISTENDIRLLGFGLRSTIHDNYYSLKKKVQEGGKINALIVDPYSVDMKIIAKRFSRGGTPENFMNDYEKTVTQFSQLKKYASNPENVKLKLVAFVPSFSIYFFPKVKDGGLIFVEIYGYKSPLRAAPKFTLSKSEKEVWYNHFKQQFDIMWKDSKKVDL